MISKLWMPVKSFIDTASIGTCVSVNKKARTVRPSAIDTGMPVIIKAIRSANTMIARHNLAVIARLDRAIQYSRDAGGMRKSRGALDSPPSRGMTAVGGARRIRKIECTYFDGAGAGLKSTFGAVEISFSFSTAKFGFSL